MRAFLMRGLRGLALRGLCLLALGVGASTPRLLVPAYWWPTVDGDGACDQADFVALAGAGASAVAVVNPDNGPWATPGDADDATFAACFALCRAAGVELVGYVKTKRAEETSPGDWVQRGFRDVGEIEADVAAWAATGRVDGIFYDEVSNLWAPDDPNWEDAPADDAAHEAFYAHLFATARASFGVLYANPGSAYYASYVRRSPKFIFEAPYLAQIGIVRARFL